MGSDAEAPALAAPPTLQDDPGVTEAGQRAAQLRDFFAQFKKSTKNIALYRHNPAQHLAFIQAPHALLASLLERVPNVALRVESRSFSYLNQQVYEEESDEHNLALRFHRDGVRVLTFRQGLPPEELLGFAMVCLSAPRDAARVEDDVASLMWQKDFKHIEHVVMDSFALGSEAEGAEAQVEVSAIVDHLYQRMSTTSADSLQFARVSLDDLELQLKDVGQMGGLAVQGKPATVEDQMRAQFELDQDETHKLLPRMGEILVELFDEEPDLKLAELLASAFTQLLDSFLLQGNLEAIGRLVAKLDALARSALPAGSLAVANHTAHGLRARMAEVSRLGRVADVLDSNPAPELQRHAATYLACLDAKSVQPLLETLERMNRPEARKLVCDRLAAFGPTHLPLYVERLKSPKANLVRDMLYLVGCVAPAEKTTLMLGLLNHPNLALRLEALAAIGDGADPSAGPYVVRALGDAESQVRMTAARLMLNFDPTTARRTLLALVGQPTFEGRTAQEQAAIYAALAATNAPEALEYFLAELRRTSLLQRKQLLEHKKVILHGLAASGSIAVYRLLQAELKAGLPEPEVAALAERTAARLRERLLGAASSASLPAVAVGPAAEPPPTGKGKG
ncbi:MAG TPA: hypothetical protein PK668_10335 [Myxococcota bacterium]|nr:hypothetical protein [Myxococcota bacterium]HRY93435.1 hypothetical protein [Myxococcota bacterium]HSA20998.1 hypothetical protein [Myxococcota bacterium]